MSFLLSQLSQIRSGGASVLLKKTWRCVLLLIVCLVRIIRPLVLVRFGALLSHRLGHYACNTELYLCEKDVGIQPRHSIDLFFNGPQVSNQQLKIMWGRVLHVSSLFRDLYEVNRLVPGFEQHIVSLPWDRDTQNLYDRTKPHLKFTREEEKRGKSLLREMGVPEDAPFVCIYARDSAYLREIFPEGDWSYHDHRNSSIDNFAKAAETLVSRGYYVLRMGAVVSQKLSFEKKGIIDYSSRFRTDFMDIFLLANCRFSLGDPCGMNGVPIVFRRPVATPNLIPLGYSPTWSRNLFIPKKHWLKNEARFMTFREVLDSGVAQFLEAHQYVTHGIEVVENTPAEIMDLAVEMDERIKGVWKSSDEDEELQCQFWSLFNDRKTGGVSHARICAAFLRNNRQLLR